MEVEGAGRVLDLVSDWWVDGKSLPRDMTSRQQAPLWALLRERTVCLNRLLFAKKQKDD